MKSLHCRYLASTISIIIINMLTFHMCKSTEWTPWTVSSLPHVVAFRWFVNLETKTEVGEMMKIKSITQVQCCKGVSVSPLGGTVVRCESGSTDSCPHSHTWRVRPIHRHALHSGRASTCQDIQQGLSWTEDFRCKKSVWEFLSQEQFYQAPMKVSLDLFLAIKVKLLNLNKGDW